MYFVRKSLVSTSFFSFFSYYLNDDWVKLSVQSKDVSVLVYLTDLGSEVYSS